MQKLAKERSDLDTDMYVGDLDEGVAIVKNNLQNDYDVILSRGGTAERIRRFTFIPVIEITLSVYDILRAIKLAENYAEQYAVVGFNAITDSAHLLCDLLQYKIDIFTIHNEDEVQETLRDCKKKGYRMILCDMIASTVAKHLGINAILVTSGAESISTAFDQAVKVSKNYTAIHQENHFLREIIRKGNSDTLILRHDGKIFFTSLPNDRAEAIAELLMKEVPAVLEQKIHKFFKNIDGTLYSFSSYRLEHLEESYAVFYFSSSFFRLLWIQTCANETG